MNYNFKANWDQFIIPHLENPKLLRAIRRGVNAYLDNEEKVERYTNSRAPASYMSLDCFYNELEDVKEQYFYEQKENGLLDERLVKLEQQIDIYIQQNGENDDDELSNLYEQVFEIENEIFDNEYKFTKPSLKNNIISYQFYSACHWWNSTFGITLARIVQPEIKWKVQRSKKHTTVISIDRQFVFDILYYDEDDVSLGGANAISSSRHRN